MNTARRFFILFIRSVGVIGVLFLLPSQVFAWGGQWSWELTQRTELSSDPTIAAHCPAGSSNGDATPGRPAGGWWEDRFMTVSPQYFQGLPAGGGGTTYQPGTSGDVTRRCPRTFNEYTYNHLHGVMNARSAMLNNIGFVAFDSLGGYYGQNKIKLQQDPSNMAVPTNQPGWIANNARSATVWEFSRNARNYVDNNPASPYYQGPFSAAGCAADDGGATDPDHTVDGLFGGKKFDASWLLHTGADHEKTNCAAPATIQTFDPDVFMSTTKTFVAWSERYVEGTYIDPSRVTTNGFDSAHPGSFSTFPYRRLGLHVDMLDSGVMMGARFNGSGSIYAQSGRRAALTTATEDGELKVNAAFDVISPRVTGIWSGGDMRPVVAWAEAPFTFLAASTDYSSAALSGGFNIPNSSTFGLAAGAQANLYVKMNTANVAGSTNWASLPTSGSLGAVCNAQEVSSGRASGRKRSYGSTHDIDTISDANLNDTPILVRTIPVGAGCGVQVMQWSLATGSWTILGGSDLRQNTTRNVAWPRIVVYKNVPYVAWVEQDPSHANDQLFAARYNATTGGWEFLHNPDSADNSLWAAAYLRGPAIALTTDTTSWKSGIFAPINFDHLIYSLSAQSNDGTHRVYVSSCPTLPGQSCIAYATPVRQKDDNTFVDGTSVPMYDRRNTDFGISWGMRTMGLPPSGGLSQQVGWQIDPREGKPGATDLISSRNTAVAWFLQHNQSTMATWTGPVQDHREFDQGVYAKAMYEKQVDPVFKVIGRVHAIDFNQGSTHVMTYGSGANGKLGNGSTADSVRPVSVTLPGSPTIVRAKASANNSGALTDTGALYVWGYNGYGALCTGDVVDRTTPTLAPLQLPVMDFAFTNTALVVLLGDGSVQTCGTGNYGELGTGVSTSTVFVPVRAMPRGPGINDVVGIDAGGYHACAVRTGGLLWCWGYNYDGELGVGTATTSAPYGIGFATQVAGSLVVQKLSLGMFHTAAVDKYGGLKTWGYNGYGELGLGNYANASAPQSVSLPGSIRQISANAYDTYVLLDNGGAWSTGYNGDGELGTGTSAGSSPSFVYVMGNVDRLSAGAHAQSHALMVTADAVKQNVQYLSFGYNSNGQLGNGGTTNATTPTAALDGARFGCVPGTTAWAMANYATYALYYCPSGGCADGTAGPSCYVNNFYSDLQGVTSNNDAPQFAQDLPSTPGGWVFYGTTANKTNDAPNPSCAYSTAPDVWYRLHPTQNLTATLSTVGTGTNFDTVICLHQDTWDGPVVACNDDYGGLQSQISASLTAGVSYYLDIDGYSTNSGNFQLNVSLQ